MDQANQCLSDHIWPSSGLFGPAEEGGQMIRKAGLQPGQLFRMPRVGSEGFVGRKAAEDGSDTVSFEGFESMAELWLMASPRGPHLPPIVEAGFESLGRVSTGVVAISMEEMPGGLLGYAFCPIVNGCLSDSPVFLTHSFQWLVLALVASFL